MDAFGEAWAVVLAAGEGTRLRALTTDEQGLTFPKQFCSLDGRASLMQLALHRASTAVSWARTTAIVAEQHERWWRPELAFMPERNVIVQPRNRGTAIGVLLPLLRILERDERARVVFVPSDHYVSDESVVTRAMRTALSVVEQRAAPIVLLGIVPDEPDSEFGWIVPSSRERSGVWRVERFVEKPPYSVAARLMRVGGVWNSFIFAARAEAVLELFRRRLPRALGMLWDALAVPGGRQPAALERAYEQLHSFDFCRDLLQGAEARLGVLPVPRCGWCDLGTPERVRRCVERLESGTPAGDGPLPVDAQAVSAAATRPNLALAKS